MSADAAAAEAAAASEVLDLNADAAAVDSREHVNSAVADRTKPGADETLTEPSMSSRASGEESLSGEGRGASEDGGREVVVEAGVADAAARPVADVVAGGREALEGVGSTGGDVEGQLAEANAQQSAGAEILEWKTEVAVKHADGSGGAETLSLRAEDRILEECTESDGGKTLPEVDHVVQETSGVNQDSPVGSEVGVDVGTIHAVPQPTKEEDYRGDVVAPDLNSAVDIVQSVKSENMCLPPVAEKPRDRGDVVVAETNVVTGIAGGEIQATTQVDVSTDLLDDRGLELGEKLDQGDVVVAETNVVSGIAGAEIQATTQVDVSTDLLDDRGLELGEKLEGTSEKAQSGGDASAVDSRSVDKLQALDQNGDPEVPPVNGDGDTSQAMMSDDILPDKVEKIKAHPQCTVATDDNSVDTKCVDMSGSALLAQECLPESSQLGQNLSQVSISADQVPSEKQGAEVQNVCSLLDENQDSQPNLVVGQDVSVTTSADLEIEGETPKTGIIPSEEMHGREANLNQEDDRGNLPSDVREDEVAEADTDGDRKELNMPEPPEKEDKFEKCLSIHPGAVGTENNQCASYNLPREDMNTFSISDLVWGKVKSHPWWPGQIFNPTDASDMALKHQKKDNFLVAYFGDKTFAWCDESKLRPFHSCFFQLENQSTSDVFINAVNSALSEVSRRLELGMSCICVPEEVISSLKHQKIENAGIREGSSGSVVDKYFGVATFEPNNFLDYIKALALYPCGGMDKLGLVIAKAQLLAFNRLKYHTEFSASSGREGLLENDAVTSPSWRKRSHKALDEHPSPTSKNEEMVTSDLSLGKRKKSQGTTLHRQKHIPEHGRKEKSLSELMDDKNYSDLVNGDGTAIEMKASRKSFAYSSGKKRRKDDSTSPYSGKSKRKRLDALGDLEKKTPTSDRSFKVGECISRVASKLTGSPSIIKCNGESLKKGSTGKADQGVPQVFDVSVHTPEDGRRLRRGVSKSYSSPEEMLSQLCLAAKDPMKGYGFLSAIICFFTEVRELRDAGSMVDKRFERIKKKRGRKKRSESNDDSKNKLSGTHTPSSPATDEKASEKIGRKRGRKKKSEAMNDSKTDATDASTPDYMTDSYWTDRIVCSSPEGKSQSSRRKRKGELLTQCATKKTKPSQESLSLSKMLEAAHHLRISAVSPTASRDSAVEKQTTFFGDKCLEESTPTALILSFNEPDALPSDTNLIRIFSRYGPLKEADTEVLSETNSAKVVFKRRADAEVAFSSAGKYCIFGPALVSYRLRNLPSTPMASPEVRSDGRKDTKTLDGVSLETPAEEEVNGLVQNEAEGLHQKETKESVPDEVEESTQEGAKELAQDQAKNSGQDEINELCQREVKELGREEAKGLTQEEAKELAQAEAKEFIQEGAKELAQDEVKDLAQDEMRELRQEESKELVQEEAKDLNQEDAKELAQAEAKEFIQEGAKELAQDEVKDLAQDEMRELRQEESKELVQEEAKDLNQEEAKELAQAVAKE